MIRSYSVDRYCNYIHTAHSACFRSCINSSKETTLSLILSVHLEIAGHVGISPDLELVDDTQRGPLVNTSGDVSSREAQCAQLPSELAQEQ